MADAANIGQKEVEEVKVKGSRNLTQAARQQDETVVVSSHDIVYDKIKH